MKTLILFKAVAASIAEESESSFEVTLGKHFRTISIKTLNFEFKNQATLKSCLSTPENYAGIIFTSPRCVESVHNALPSNDLNEQWKTKRNYAVGPKTVQCASNSLNLKCLGAESGNAYNLGDIILKDREDDSENKPFLYPRGNIAKDTLKNKLGDNMLHDVIAYDTVISPMLENDLKSATENFHLAIDYVVFFSPSGADAVLPYIDKLGPKTKVIAIGPTTQSALTNSNVQVTGTCEHPTATSLLKLLNILDKT